MRRFDRTFGPDFLDSVPRSPGVYVYRDRDDRIVYVGKAVDLRARLGQYRNASRRKVHRKMHRIVRESARIELRPTEDEQAALLLENALIRAHRPRLNVAGAFAFLYPTIALRRSERHFHLAYTTSAEPLAERGFALCGCYRNRSVAREGFDALVQLLEVLGHRERAPEALPYTAWRRFRQVPPELDAGIEALLRGTSDAVLEPLALALVEKPAARRDARDVQKQLRTLRRFHRDEASRLPALAAVVGAPWIPQDARDAADIRAGFEMAPRVATPSGATR